MTTYQHPGVYVEELPGPQLISQVSTSNAAFVGRTETGKANTPVLITSWNAYTSNFGGLAWGAQTPFAVYAFFNQGGAICYVTPAEATGEAPAKAELSPLIVTAATPGSWGNLLYLQLVNSPVETPPASDAKPIFSLNVLVKEPEAGSTPSFDETLILEYVEENQITASIIEGESYYLLESFMGLSANALVKASTPGAVAPIETQINASSLFIRVSVPAGTAATRPANVTTPEQLSSGVGDTSSTPLNINAALTALDPLDNISLLIAPETGLIESLETQRETAQEVLTYCENRPHHDLFAILDAPYGISVQDVEAYKTGGAVGDAEAGVALHSSYGALFYPWVELFDPITSRNVLVPPSGMMAGTFAATDIAVGPWQSPAGVTYGALNTAAGVHQVITTTDQDILNPNGINAIRPFTGYGILAYGARTLTTDPSLQYISVRRTLMDIELSLYRGLQWVVFQPNTPKLWGSVTRDVTEFLTEMWQEGALVGEKSSDAFWVKCDDSNNPPALQRQGELCVDIGVAPSYPAEFVIIRIQQTTVSAS